MIEKNEKSGELMEVKEQAKTVRKHPERMIVRIWLVLALICLLAGLIAQYTFRLKEPLFLHYSQSAYLGCGLDGVETSEDGIVSSVSSEALEEESTDSDVKVGVLDEGVKDPNANMGLENTVSLYALGTNREPNPAAVMTAPSTLNCSRYLSPCSVSRYFPVSISVMRNASSRQSPSNLFTVPRERFKIEASSRWVTSGFS